VRDVRGCVLDLLGVLVADEHHDGVDVDGVQPLDGVRGDVQQAVAVLAGRTREDQSEDTMRSCDGDRSPYYMERGGVRREGRERGRRYLFTHLLDGGDRGHVKMAAAALVVDEEAVLDAALDGLLGGLHHL